MNGDPNYFLGLINSNYLQVGGLIVSNTWVFGDIVDLEIQSDTTNLTVRLLGEPGHEHVLEGSTDFKDWMPVLTNSPVNSYFDFQETNCLAAPLRFFRALRSRNDW